MPSQAFFGIWPTTSDLPVEAIEALINSPLASAFVLERASNQHLTNVVMKQLPLPKRGALGDVVAAVWRYRDALGAAAAHALRTPEIDERLEGLLIDIDAQLLKAFDLPPRLERRSCRDFACTPHPMERFLRQEYHQILGIAPHGVEDQIQLFELVRIEEDLRWRDPSQFRFKETSQNRGTSLVVAEENAVAPRGPQPSVGSVVASGKDTALSRNTGGSSARTTDPMRKGLESSASVTTTRSTREPSRVVVITGAVGMVDDPRC